MGQTVINTKSMAELLDTLPQIGQVKWIGLRTQRRAPMTLVESVRADTTKGLLGDRYAGSSGKRQVTLVQYEHLAVIASLLSNEKLNKDGMLDPAKLKRNIVVSSLNLLALKGKQFVIGGAVLEYTGLCHPCSFMEQTLGTGGYNAVRGHGGITARVIVSGQISLNDQVTKKMP